MAVTETVPFTRQSPNEVQQCLWNSEYEKRINFHLITSTLIGDRSCHEFIKALALFGSAGASPSLKTKSA
jgi:hypothetical protein